jgi:hypothetical protein
MLRAQSNGSVVLVFIIDPATVRVCKTRDSAVPRNVTYMVENPVPGFITGPPCSWGINTGTWPALQVGGVTDETVKYGREFCGTLPKSDSFGKAQKQLYSKLQTRPLVREDAI